MAASWCLLGRCSDLDLKTQVQMRFLPLRSWAASIGEALGLPDAPFRQPKGGPQPHLFQAHLRPMKAKQRVCVEVQSSPYGGCRASRSPQHQRPRVWLLGWVAPGWVQEARASRWVRGCGATGWNALCLNLGIEGFCLLNTAPCRGRFLKDKFCILASPFAKHPRCLPHLVDAL